MVIVIAIAWKLIDEGVVDAEIMDAASLVAVAGPEKHDFDRESRTDRAGAFFPGAVDEGALVPLPKILGCLG
ncbi:hypothetical protein, partial [Mesorhizobium sp. M8A.F.Ca.ET.182.01.1.1]|uniref:hypothetical protein n=1 Tax=Mesorhizobium sp. M8A.F.Ca.ET.182.01.1.1 TaxID=2563964 RepID=UPI001AEDD028